MKRFLSGLLLSLAIFFLTFFSLAYADFGDYATLGGKDDSGEYHWRVNSSGNIIPGTTAQNSIGDSSHKVKDMYMSGDLYFRGQLQGTGIGTGGVSTVPTDVTEMDSTGYSLFSVFVTTRTLNLSNGEEGEVITLVGRDCTDTGTLTITATTKTGWTSISMDAVNDSVTLLYIDSVSGWIIIGPNSVSIS